MKRPNILIITTDQHSAHMMSCAGNQWLSTPNMDRLAAEGVCFERAYAGCPVCMPQRFSWWTGRMPSAIGLRSNYDSPASVPREVHENSVGHLLRRAGYRAVIGGKVHVPADLTAESIGFETLTSDTRDRLAVEGSMFIPGDHSSPWLLALNFDNPHDICYQAILAHARSEESQKLIANAPAAIAELDEVVSPRSRWDDEEFYSSVCPPLPANHMPQADEPQAISDFLRQRQFKANARASWSGRDWRLHRWIYYRLTERVDSQIGPVLDALESSGQKRSTVVIFTSDHGDHSASPKLEHKTVFYEEALRVPLIIADPASSAAVSDDLVQTGIDLMATCCDYAHVEKPEFNLGRSVRSIAAGQNPEEWRTGGYAENEISYMHVTSAHKLVRYDYGRHRRQLYDLVNDPGETANALAGSPEIADKLSAALDSEYERHHALLVTRS